MASATATSHRSDSVVGLIDQPPIAALEAGRGSDLERMLLDSLPNLRRWARRKLPQAARGHMDTCDLVQEVALLTVAHLTEFSPRHESSMSAYLRQVARNRVCDEFRRASRRPQSVPLEDTIPSGEGSPLSSAIRAQARQRYREALRTLRGKDRGLLIARYDRERDFTSIAAQFGFPSVAAARMAVGRAERRLMLRLEAVTR
jgi:RNA polymerase sigma factor (sigma-70 family)